MRTIVAVVLTVVFLPVMAAGFVAELGVAAFEAGQRTAETLADWIAGRK